MQSRACITIIQGEVVNVVMYAFELSGLKAMLGVPDPQLSVAHVAQMTSMTNRQESMMTSSEVSITETVSS